LPGLLLKIGKTQKPYNNLLAKARNLTTIWWQEPKILQKSDPYSQKQTTMGKKTIA
jgi:hypothetical protein